MLAKRMTILMMMLSLVWLFTNCQEEELMMRKGKGASVAAVSEDDSDSDRPAWAGGNTDANTHSKGNTDTGIPKGSDYGDLYVLLRDANGVPELIQKGDHWFVQPVDIDGNALPLNDEGELIDPSLAREVEFGRLNIVRAPQTVLDAGFMEALGPLTADGATITLDFCGRLTSTYEVEGIEVVKTIDSPRENLALYQYIMQNLFVEGPSLDFLGKGPYNFDPLVIAASCYAAGSDKTDVIDVDELVYINGFLGASGLNAIANENEFDARGDVKMYFNFGDIYGNGNFEFTYDRESTYSDRFIQFAVWEGVFMGSEGPIFSIYDYMSGNVDGIDRWTDREYDDSLVEGFAKAADDALQVLDVVHGDSNIQFLPGFVPGI